MRRRPLVAVVCAVVVAALVAAGIAVVHQRRQRAADAGAAAAAHALASAWSAGHLTSAEFTTPGAARQYATVTAGLGGAHPRVRVRGVHRHGRSAVATLDVAWALGTGWRYRTTAHLVQVHTHSHDQWRTRFTPDLVLPGLRTGQQLVAARTPATRGQVLGRGGTPIVTDSPVVEVGVAPSRTTDPAGLAAALAKLVGVDAAALTTAIAKAAPTAFVPVITLRASDYAALAGQLQPLPGTVFTRSSLPLAPTPAFARALLGRVGPATADIVSASGGRVTAGDLTGVSGLQREDDARLAGRPATTVEVADAKGKAVRTVSSTPAVAGKPVQLTIDARVQEAADAALATARSNDATTAAALVAIDVPSGDVLAVANTPATGSDRALVGRYPPGSTFKTVTTTALLGTGLTPATTVPCTPSATVSGKVFTNFEGEAFGDVPFRSDFADSCNTAFVGLSSRLGAGDLRDAAASLGLGGTWTVGTSAFTGSVPVQASAVDRAAASIGQGTVLASPLSMAVVAATIARGAWVAPHLVTTPAPPAVPPAAGPAPTPDPTRAAVVRDLMRSVVTSGTASALAPVPGAPVYAKTGTAEYGSAKPPQVQTWTIGFQGDVAFAVLVENGTSGAVNAVPVAGAFLRSLG